MATRNYSGCSIDTYQHKGEVHPLSEFIRDRQYLRLLKQLWREGMAMDQAHCLGKPTKYKPIHIPKKYRARLGV